jgi:hypothetical protein
MELIKRTNRMTNEPNRREIIDEGRAAYLLGLPKEQLREICELSGLGHLEEGTTALRLVFTYEELYRLCRLIVGPTS